MRGKSLVLIAVALGSGLIASIGVSQVVARSSQQQAPPGPEMKQVLVAAKAININDAITPDAVQLSAFPVDSLPEGVITKTESIDGVYARTWIAKGEILLESKITKSRGDNATVPKGFRVTPLDISPQDMPRFLAPGNHVDVLLLVDPRRAAVKERVVKTVLSNIRVFSVNGKYERPRDITDDYTARSVDLLVTPEQAEVILLAGNLGTIKLSLRHNDETGSVKRTAINSSNVLNGDADGNNPDDGTEFLHWLREIKPIEPPLEPVVALADKPIEKTPEPAPAPAPAPVAPEPPQEKGWSMVILTPTGPRKFYAASEHDIPREVPTDSSPGGSGGPLPGLPTPPVKVTPVSAGGPAGGSGVPPFTEPTDETPPLFEDLAKMTPEQRQSRPAPVLPTDGQDRPALDGSTSDQ